MTRNKDDDDLIGFRDFLDAEQTETKKKQNTVRKQNDFELVTFLEQDSSRISNLIETFEEKAYVIKNYSQDPALNIESEHELINSQAAALSLSLRSDAPIYRNLAEVFNNFFKSN